MNNLPEIPLAKIPSVIMGLSLGGSLYFGGVVLMGLGGLFMFVGSLMWLWSIFR